MQSLILFCTLFQAIYLGVAGDTFNCDQDGRIISVLLKKIWDLEERDREFDRKLEEIDVLKEHIDEAQRRLTNMQELESKLEKAEEQIQMLVTRVANINADCKVNKSATMQLLYTNRTHDNVDIGSSGSVRIQRAVSNIESRQAEMGDKIAELVSFKNRIQTDGAHTKAIRMASARKVAFSARFSSSEILLLTGHPLVFDLVETNQGNGYSRVTGIFTCPISGTYCFYTNVLTSGSNTNRVDTEIVLDGVGKAKTLASKPDNYDQGSAATIIHCGAGQMVWIRTTLGSITYGESYTSFSGFLLWEDADAVNSN